MSKFVVGLIEKLAIILPQMLLDWANKKKMEKAQQEALKKYEEVSAKPEPSMEEKAKAYEDAINAGRK